MPLFWVHTKKKAEASADDLRATLNDHLRWQFENETTGKILAAGPLFDPDSEGPPAAGMYVLVSENADEARARADTDPFHARGLREYTMMRWSLNESAYLGVALRAALNGDDPSEEKYHPPKD
ncbi:MAG: YciI family protein [bacterium]